MDMGGQGYWSRAGNGRLRWSYVNEPGPPSSLWVYSRISGLARRSGPSFISTPVRLAGHGVYLRRRIFRLTSPESRFECPVCVTWKADEHGWNSPSVGFLQCKTCPRASVRLTTRVDGGSAQQSLRRVLVGFLARLRFRNTLPARVVAIGQQRGRVGIQSHHVAVRLYGGMKEGRHSRGGGGGGGEPHVHVCVCYVRAYVRRE